MCVYIHIPGVPAGLLFLLLGLAFAPFSGQVNCTGGGLIAAQGPWLLSSSMAEAD